VDPGKWQVYKHVGAQALLADGACQVFFIWDPDGDRFNMITTAPAALAGEAQAAGLEVDPLDADRCLVFFKPNQIYFMLTALKLDALRAAGELEQADWIVATTWPTSLSIGEIAEKAGLATHRVPVGFKHFAALVRDLEAQATAGNDPCTVTDVTGAVADCGARPRLLIMAEESGGAAMGPAEPMTSRHGARTSLAPKEKDAMQLGVMALCLAARLHRTGGSFAGYYGEQLARWETRYRFYERRDVTLFDESLQGEERARARAAGNRLKEATVAFFAGLEDRTPEEATRILVAAMPADSALPTLERIFHAGDGTYLEFTGQWFELRASGTDAVLRYYMEGADRSAVAELNEAFARLELPDLPA
jgi:phosphomannomutase